jgi:alpha-glucuronidase
MTGLQKTILSFLLCFVSGMSWAESGYNLWLRYEKITDEKLLATYRRQIKSFIVAGATPTLNVAGHELTRGLSGLLATSVKTDGGNFDLVCGTFSTSAIQTMGLSASQFSVGSEGFIIKTVLLGKRKVIAIASNEDIGILYGVFHFLRLLQAHQDISSLSIVSFPKIKLRVLNHWDNLDRTVERGYAGFSIWNWHKLPGYIDERYIDYARANASIGINGTVLTNVNANALILTPDYLKKVAALADAFRPYGVRVYLTARFNAPMELDGLPTADPDDKEVVDWWNRKAKEIYRYVPDFGGFVVKANSEGQPGPQNYGRSHSDGANMLADAVQPFGGVVMWRAFVYSNEVPEDRAKQAFNEFKPLDGAFKKNVLVQVKNGAIDFQPREPFHPLFGAMPKTPLMMEFQITQEYLGYSSHLVYLPTLFKETLDADTQAKGPGSTVASVIDGTLEDQELTGMAGVANIGTDINWCGHPFAQANWYAFGRLAWNHSLTADAIADEWIRMTFTNDPAFIKDVKSVMLASREITVNYMTPLGLHHIMGWNHHHGPGPWVKDKHRADWTSVYYHKADSLGLGFDRTANGSDAIGQYAKPIRNQFSTTENCPEEFLLWFHHVSWDYQTRSGKSLWDELCFKYYAGVDSVKWMQQVWDKQKGKVDEQRFNQVKMLLKVQFDEAVIWRDACVLYFQTFSKKSIPSGLEKPANSLEYYIQLTYPYAPGIKPQW